VNFITQNTPDNTYWKKDNSSLHVRIHDRRQTDWKTETGGLASSPVQSRSRDSHPVTSVQSTQATTASIVNRHLSQHSTSC